MDDSPNSFEVLQLAEGDQALSRLILDPQRILLLPISIKEEGSRINVLRVEDLSALLQSLPADTIKDRGKKNNAKPLSTYLFGHEGLLAIRASYRNHGQAMRGLRALRAAIASYNTPVAFFVGVDGALFGALERRAAKDAQPAAPLSDAAAHLRVLIDEKIVVPDSLKQTYLGASPQVDWVRRSIVLAARVEHPVLIQGETGTGKEIVAQQIHALSGRHATGVILPVNCGGISSELLESELFGHARGAYTGATGTKDGLWTMANNGTLFLDEIGDLSPRHQVKVLRALEDGEYIPVGATSTIKSNARIIAATNRDLAAMVLSGDFREDLYYRLFNFRIRTPALREHREDIPRLAHHFWDKVSNSTAPPLTRAVTGALEQCRWPGNARELRAFLANLFIFANGRKVDIPLVRAVMLERLGPLPPKRKDL